MESEYNALSMSLQAAIPLMDIAVAVTNGLHHNTKNLVTFQATVHEDNQGAPALTKLEIGCHTPRSKFYAIKLHWFCSWLKHKHIEIIFCPTHLQKADFLTKPLTKEVLRQNRQLSMGW